MASNNSGVSYQPYKPHIYTPINPIQHIYTPVDPSEQCKRCGHSGHVVDQCMNTHHIDGSRLLKKEEPCCPCVII